MRQSERRLLHAIIDTEAACVKLMSADGLLLEMNRAGLAMIEADDISQVAGRPVLDLIHPDDRSRFVLAHQRAAEGSTSRLEFRMIGLRGAQRWLEMHAVPFQQQTTGRTPALVLSVTNDVTERKALEEQLRQSQKLEAVGRLAGGVAHDFNNLITAILGFSELAMTKAAPDTELHDDLVEIRDAADRAAALIYQLLAFSRKQVLEPHVLDLNQVVSRLLTVLPRIIGEDVQVGVELDPDLLHVKVDPTQLDQILMNLAVNARDAMPDGGSLRLQTTNVNLTSSPVANVSRFRPGAYVVLAVTDTGTGMSSETKAHLFEPFFTTKDAGAGTGLGLSTVYGIVKQSDGYITVDTKLGHGTTFTIYLPGTSASIDAVPSVPRAVEPDGRGTVLVVEDSAQVRELVRRTLEAAGYRVLAARDAHGAIHITTVEEGRIDLLLTDIVMPGLTGPQLVAQIRRGWPSVRTLYMTGYADRLQNERDGETETPLLSKPFSSADLLSAVKKALEA